MVDYNPFDEDQNAPQPGGGPQSVPQVIGATTSQMNPNAEGQTVTGTGSGGQSQQRGSGRFTNIQKYLKANQDSNIGQQLGQKVEAEAKPALANIGAARDQVQQKLASEQQRLGGADQLFNKVQNYQGKTALSQQEYEANPQDLRPKTPGMFQTQQFQPSSYEDYLASVGPQVGDEDISAFQKIYQGQADAPVIDNMTDLQVDAQKVDQLAQSAGTEQGRFGLLNQFFGRPTYSTGQQRLDQLLLQTQPQEAKGLAQLASSTNKETQAQLNALKSLQETGITDLATQAAQKQAQAKELLGSEALGVDKQGSGLLGGIVDSIETRASEANAKKAREQQMLLDIFGKSKVGQGEESGQQALETLRRLGLNPDDQVYLPEGMSPQTFISPAQEAGYNKFATPEERARYLTLQKLAGNQAPGFFKGDEELGGYDANDFFNRDQFNKTQSETKDRLFSTLNPVQSQRDALDRQTYGDYWNSLGDSNFGMADWKWAQDKAIRLADLDKQIASIKQPYGGTSVKDLIARYSGLPVNTTLQNASNGKIGLF